MRRYRPLRILILTALLVILLASACGSPSPTPATPTTAPQATDEIHATAPAGHATLPAHGTPFQHEAGAPAATPTPINATEEAEIKDLVESFGKRLQAVWLQSPNVAQEMKGQYSEFVSPALLETWMGDISKAPGRVVSSPWPDRIEITTLVKEDSDKYMVTGFIVEVTSVEVVSGGAAAKIPVRIVVQKVRDRWVIVEYSEQR